MTARDVGPPRPLVQKLLPLRLHERGEAAIHQRKADGVEEVRLSRPVASHHAVVVLAERSDFHLVLVCAEAINRHLLDVHGAAFY